MKGFGEQQKSKKKSNKKTKHSKEKIINQAIQFHLKGNIQEATKYYQQIINQGCNDHRVFSNYGVILKDLGKYQDAESSTRKAIELNPNFANAHSNLGIILSDVGKLEEAELSYRKAILIKPDYAEAHSNLGNLLRDLGKFKDAENSYRKAVELKPNFTEAHYNLGNIFRVLGKLEQAEISMLKAIELNPNFSAAHNNLGNILKDLGKFQQAEISILKAIELNPNLVKAYFALSTLNPSNNKNKWQDKLFSESILNHSREKDQVDIFFARANILEEKYEFSQASKYLKKANNLNRNIYGSDYLDITRNINIFDQELQENKILLNYTRNFPIPIFIFGMPRSGKTITESILACNNKLTKLGENPSLEKAIKIYLEAKENSLNPSLLKLYYDYIQADYIGKQFISATIPINVFNYGLIISEIETAKVIYCYRNPLDNIKEIYKKNMGNKHTYSCSIDESAKLWIEVYALMEKYKKKYSSKVYFLNYDNLVTNTEEEIKHLLNWLGWENDIKYIKPNLDPTTIKITNKFNSKIINKNEISSWKSYQDLLKPAIKIFNSNTMFKMKFNQYLSEFNQ
ncbi:tetratricopeptide repeat-containing sulfotransferase family protein [Prochlorococcus marinus]|uniref:tetratricopeptide repeat-containing sulfotransferase family protein n=1 Tax=Prochlorococcus marinus TaxID=1219 RepID=UPI0022B5D606|nr:tetratricopeptide repeat-containing sulfotransferase family protein [Prochlorococcus marinus]